MRTLILASRSPRRKQILEQAGLDISIFPSSIKEPAPRTAVDPLRYAIDLALLKAENVAKKLKNGIVIGADTIVVVDNKIFGKPRNQKHAKKILTLLSGKTQYIYTALAVIDIKTKTRIVDIEKTTIIANKLSKTQINKLSETNHDKAGAYAVQKDGDILIKKIIGDYYNVVGLPIKRLKNILRIFSVDMKDLKN